ncbi:unnamed protein product [Darwinula stevensoni]|uniref:Scavenger receptor class B member 1 n=1 Tax=Darwinula stevensoni TaxID=69355 RepID=A0A7R9AEP2_9CRUS|nr:unnamed protein product [Darwinula stevensoni]CAG0902507.1 unnamed protein product [Darwinula stevensoni]
MAHRAKDLKLPFIAPFTAELIWTRFNMTLMQRIKVKELYWGKRYPILKLLKNMGIKNFRGVKDDKMGIYIERNDTDDGLYLVATGKNNPEDYTRILRWNQYTTKVPWWGDTPCSMINGTDGNNFRPFLTKESKIYAFNPDVCSSHLNFESFFEECLILLLKAPTFSPEYSDTQIQQGIGARLHSYRFPHISLAHPGTQLATLKEGVETYDHWVKPFVPVYWYTYVFNVTNPDWQSKGQRPRFHELGPYVYWEFMEKRNITFYDNGTLSYRQYRAFYFQPDMSKGKETDEIYTLNPVLLTMAHRAKDLKLPFIAPFTAELIWTRFNMTLMQRIKVKELYWGKRYPILKLLKNMGIKNFRGVKDDKMGIYIERNDTDDGLYLVATGKNNPEDYTRILRWNQYTTKVPWWGDTPCSMINGTDGNNFRPFLTKESKIYAFNPDVCRSAHMTYREPMEFMGVPGYRFRPPPCTYVSSRDDPANACFCETKECLGNGVLNSSSCLESPVTLSSPHFLHADPKFVNDAPGLKPVEEEHGSYAELEPNSGVPLRLSKKVQVSFQLAPLAGFPTLQGVPDMIFPVTWLEEKAILSPETAALFHTRLLTPLLISSTVSKAAIVLGVMLLLAWVPLYIARSAGHQGGIRGFHGGADPNDDQRKRREAEKEDGRPTEGGWDSVALPSADGARPNGSEGAPLPDEVESVTELASAALIAATAETDCVAMEDSGDPLFN